jgi:hypothetical protein
LSAVASPEHRHGRLPGSRLFGIRWRDISGADPGATAPHTDAERHCTPKRFELPSTNGEFDAS